MLSARLRSDNGRVQPKTRTRASSGAALAGAGEPPHHQYVDPTSMECTVTGAEPVIARVAVIERALECSILLSIHGSFIMVFTGQPAAADHYMPGTSDDQKDYLSRPTEHEGHLLTTWIA